MSFEWPLVLFALLALPVAVAAYVWLIRRRRRRAVPYSSVALIRAAAPRKASWRRHLPFALLLGALASLGMASARPQAEVDVPVSGSAVVVALDVSGSMCATDVDPNRLAAAQAAVRDFIEAQDSSTRIGLVVFAGFAQVAVPPTTERAELIDAVDSLTTGRGTMIGAAILKAVDAIAQINPDVEPVGAAVPGASGGLDGLGDSGAPGAQTPDSSSGSGGAAPQGEKKFAPEIVVLLTDGANTGGVSPAQAAQLAAERGVRIYPIGFGTTNPTTLVCTAEQLGGTRFDTFRPGGGGGPNRRSFLVADESTLREVAQTTGGTYFAASGANQLQEVLKDLPRQVEVQQKNVELSAGFAALAAVLVLASVAAAVRWSAFPN